MSPPLPRRYRPRVRAAQPAPSSPWAPIEYQRAKVARDFLRLEKAESDLLKTPGKPDARARVHYCRWYLKDSLRTLDRLGLELWGRETFSRA